MSISDLDIQLTIQLAHEQVPGFREADGYAGHPVPRIGWIYTDDDTPTAHPDTPSGWHLTDNPTKPAIFVCGTYMERDD